EAAGPDQLAAQEGVLPLQPALFQYAPDGVEHVVILEGLDNIVIGSAAHGIHGMLNGGKRGHDDDVGGRLEVFDVVENILACQLWHIEIGEHQVELLAGENVYRFMGVTFTDNVHACFLQEALEETAHGLVIVNNQDLCHLYA